MHIPLFGLTFWRHPFTAEHPLLSKWWNDTFLQIWWRNKLIYVLDALRMSVFHSFICITVSVQYCVLCLSLSVFIMINQEEWQQIFCRDESHPRHWRLCHGLVSQARDVEPRPDHQDLSDESRWDKAVLNQPFTQTSVFHYPYPLPMSFKTLIHDFICQPLSFLMRLTKVWISYIHIIRWTVHV